MKARKGIKQEKGNKKIQYSYGEGDTCVMCGRYVPEGSMVCYSCQKKWS